MSASTRQHVSTKEGGSMNRGSCLCGAIRYAVTDPQAHNFVGSKAPWHDITDALPQFKEYPPEI
jgi:hypothetical protein